MVLSFLFSHFTDSADKGEVDSGGDGEVGRKSKRTRTQTQPFQSSDLADVNLMRIIKASAASKSPAQSKQQPKAAAAAAAAAPVEKPDDKLVVFFKGEFLAVRNAEGGFYICQV